MLALLWFSIVKFCTLSQSVMREFATKRPRESPEMKRLVVLWRILMPDRICPSTNRMLFEMQVMAMRFNRNPGKSFWPLDFFCLRKIAA